MGEGDDALRLLKSIKRWEFWIEYDRSACVYEVFLDESGQTYIGCCDDIQQILRFIEEWVAEQ